MCVAEPGNAQSGTSGVAAVCVGVVCALTQWAGMHSIKVSRALKHVNADANRNVESLMSNKLSDQLHNFPRISFIFVLASLAQNLHCSKHNSLPRSSSLRPKSGADVNPDAPVLSLFVRADLTRRSNVTSPRIAPSLILGTGSLSTLRLEFLYSRASSG